MSKNYTHIYTDTRVFLARLQECGDLRVAAVVAGLLAYGNSGAFKWNAAAIARFFNMHDHRTSASELEEIRPLLGGFFVEVRPGLLALSPEVFSAVDDNPGAMS